MMDEKEKHCSIYPMYFGVSCAFAALQLLSNAGGPVICGGKWSSIADQMLQGSAQLLGLIVWKAQMGESMEERLELLNKLKKAESEVEELKRMRREDAKANEKVVGIFAAQEQNWIGERKRLRQQIQALLNRSRIVEKKREEIASNLKEEIDKKENLIRSKDDTLEEEARKRKELEEMLQMAEAAAEELRETAKREAQEHSSDLWRHKTAFLELVSTQRQLEAEMDRALLQAEMMKQELDNVLEQKEETIGMVQKLSLEAVKMQKDAEQKDKILSAMLRKSKLDTAEKQMLLKEVKIAKARRKQAELETERWKLRWESRHDKHLRADVGNRGNLRSEMFQEMKRLNLLEVACPQNKRTALQPNVGGNSSKTHLVNYHSAENGNEITCANQNAWDDAIGDCFSGHSHEGDREIVITTNARQLEDWVRVETEKYISIVERRHSAEVEAFVEQLRLKDERVETFRWQLLRMELETKRLQSDIEEVDESLSQFKEEHLKLEALLSEKENELKSLKKNCSPHAQKSSKSDSYYCTKPPPTVSENVWSEVKIIKHKHKEKDQEKKPVWIDSATSSDEFKDLNIVEISEESARNLERRGNTIEYQLLDANLTVHSLEEEFEKEKEVGMDPGNAREEFKANDSHKEADIGDKLAIVWKDTSWKMDLHALGVSYKIKRLKQKLLILGRLTATQSIKKTSTINSSINVSEKHNAHEHELKTTGFHLIMSLLNKQVKRYQSLEEKTDDLCKRLHENDQEGGSSDSGNVMTRVHTETKEHFLEEAFQLQRHMVATGQKLVEIQSRISCNFGSAEWLNESMGFNIRQFTESVSTLFQEIQRGSEVWIARIIGELEGMLACEGIMHWRP